MVRKMDTRSQRFCTFPTEKFCENEKIAFRLCFYNKTRAPLSGLVAGGEFCCKIKGEMEQKFLGNEKVAFRLCFYNKTRASLSGMDSLRGRVASLALISYGFCNIFRPRGGALGIFPEMLL